MIFKEHRLSRGRIFQQGLGIVAVDVFVLISGWFSIKPKTKSVLAFLFQIAFLKVLSFLVFLTLGKIEVNKDTITELLMLNFGHGWFINISTANPIEMFGDTFMQK